MADSTQAFVSGCRKESLETEFDLLSCQGAERQHGHCITRMSSPWSSLQRAGVVVASLGLPSPRTTELTLRERDAASIEARACGHGGVQPLDSPWPALFCIFGHGKAVQRDAAFMVEASLNTTSAILGADIGFIMWIEI